MSCEEVFAGGAPSLLAALGEELPVARHEVAVAVDDLAPVVDRPAQARSLAEAVRDGSDKLFTIHEQIGRYCYFPVAQRCTKVVAKHGLAGCRRGQAEQLTNIWSQVPNIE